MKPFILLFLLLFSPIYKQVQQLYLSEHLALGILVNCIPEKLLVIYVNKHNTYLDISRITPFPHRTHIT